MTTVGFIGLGKLGLDCAEVFAQHFTVIGYDIYPRSSDSVTILSLPNVIEASDWIFIAVPTPHESGYDGSLPSSHLDPRDFDYSAVIDTLRSITRLATQPKRVVLISTVLPGTVRNTLRPHLGDQHQLFYNPYLIAMGSVKWDMVNPEMVIVGTDLGTHSQDLVDLYRPLMQNNPRYVTGTWEEAESVKIFYNTFISTKLSLVNMIQDFAMRVGHTNVDVVTDALAQSTLRIMGPKYMTAGMGDAGSCHPRDNIALRWLAQKYDIGYDLFDTVMQAREAQARNLAHFLCDLAHQRGLGLVIHGKAYKPNVPYCVGSYSTLVGHYIQQQGVRVMYVDPLADDQTDVVSTIPGVSVILWAHSQSITYGYVGDLSPDNTMAYCTIPSGSVIVDPWRQLPLGGPYEVIHYGNSRPA